MDLDALSRVFARPQGAVPELPEDGAPRPPGDPGGGGLGKPTPHPARCQEAAEEAAGDAVSAAALALAAGDDWPEVAERPEALASLGALIRTRQQRRRGELPLHYTQPALCRTCGPVYLWAEAPRRVLACPWCLDPPAVPFPRPAVRCGTCGSFVPSETSPGDEIGRCLIDAPASRRGEPLFPNVRRPCGAWRPKRSESNHADARA